MTVFARSVALPAGLHAPDTNKGRLTMDLDPNRQSSGLTKIVSGKSVANLKSGSKKRHRHSLRYGGQDEGQAVDGAPGGVLTLSAGAGGLSQPEISPDGTLDLLTAMHRNRAS